MLEKLFGDEYDLKARYIPSLVLIAPLIVVCAFLLDQYSGGLGIGRAFRIMVGAFGGLGFGWPLVVYCLSAKVREAGRKLQERHFKNGIELPTTRMMMWSDSTFTDDYKTLVRKVVFERLGRKLPSKKNEMEDREKASRLIAETVDLIRPSVKDGVRLLQYNIRFGAERNLDACAPISCCVAFLAMVACIFLKGYAFAVCEMVLWAWFAFRWIRTPARIAWYGEEYARVFWAEFVSLYGGSSRS